MAKSTKANLAPDTDTPKLTPNLVESGYSGLRLTGTDTKVIQEECNKKMAGKELFKTVDAMLSDPYISASVSMYITMISRMPTVVVEPVGATQQEKARTEFIRQCMGDMRRGNDWQSFITDVAFFPVYGFSVSEKVFRQRLYKNGSKYNDALVGWSHFPSRKQSTIKGWVYADNGRDLVGLVQSTENLQKNPFSSIKKPNEIVIAREKFMLFTNEARYGNPQGRSFLKASYVPWRFKMLTCDSELEGMRRDLKGIPKARIPAQFLNPDADAQTKAVADNLANQLRNLHTCDQAMIILPSEYDESSRLPLFDVELMQGGGSRGYDTNQIISRYNNELLVALFADFLQMGSNGTGSFALSNSKTELIALAIQAKTKEIERVLNEDLIPQTFELNGWNTDRMPRIVFDDSGDVDIAELGSYLQRVVSVGALEMDRPALNKTRTAIGLPPMPEDMPPRKEYLPDKPVSSKASKEVGSPFDGGSKSAGGEDKSVSNKSNAA